MASSIAWLGSLLTAALIIGNIIASISFLYGGAILVVIFIPPLVVYFAWKNKNKDKEVEFVSFLSMFGFTYFVVGSLIWGSLFLVGYFFFYRLSSSYYSAIAISTTFAVFEIIIMRMLCMLQLSRLGALEVSLRILQKCEHMNIPVH